MEPSRFPNKLKMHRRNAGLSRKRVAKLLGLANTSMISRWELGITLPSVAQAFRLAVLYQVFPHELFEELWIRSKEPHSLSAEGPNQE